MIDEGVLDAAGERPVAAYALHVASGLLPLGLVASRAGTMMAVGRHAARDGARPRRPRVAAAPRRRPGPGGLRDRDLALQTMVTRQFDVFDPVVITVGSVPRGHRRQRDPRRGPLRRDRAVVLGRNRGTAVQEAAPRLVRDIATAHGLTATAEFRDGYPVTVNDAAEVAFAEQHGGRAARRRTGLRRTPYPLTGSEDFSYVLERGAGRVHHAGRVPAGRRSGHGAVQPLGRGRVRRRGAGRTARRCTPSWRCGGSPP